MGKLITTLGVWTAHPAAFLVVLVYTVLWLSFGTIDFHAFATIATWLMTLFIQRAEYRDTQAVHAKLDELLRVETRARSELAHLDAREPEEIKQHRLDSIPDAGPDA